MKFKIKSQKVSDCKKRKFCIYHHELTMKDLDDYILQIIFDAEKLNNLFQPNSTLNPKNRKKQLRAFIEVGFKNREKEVKDEEIRKKIEGNTNPTYFSFFAEALLARLNIDYLDEDLITGVLTYGSRITEGRTGADVCMFSDKKLIIGEAKFYGDLAGGLKSIIKDGTFLSKLESFCNYLIDSEKEIILKGIDGDVRDKTMEEIKSLSLILSGFVLHTKNVKGNYDTYYSKVDEIKINDFPDHFEIHLYHLPINSKDELIFKVQKKALELIKELGK